MKIIELDSEADWKEAFQVVKELRTHLSYEQYVSMLETMKPNGYRGFLLKEGETPVAYTGITERVNFYDGHHLFVYELVTKESERSKGYGEALLTFIENLAKDIGCQKMHLDSGLQRTDAHRFYEEKMGMSKKSYAFKKLLK
jgi:GNAT superfamily N-acetyltransferase